MTKAIGKTATHKNAARGTPQAPATDMMQQYRRIKANHQDALLFFRFGDFYEMFYEDAELASRELEITLTSRPQGKNEERAPMCGVPHHRLEPYVARLIEKGHKVAICEQLEPATKGKGLVQRDVVRVVTPGTFFESERQEGTLAALLSEGGSMGLAFLRLATGEFLLAETTREALPGILTRLKPQELIIKAGETLDALPHYQPHVTERPAEAFCPEKTRARLQGHFGRAAMEALYPVSAAAPTPLAQVTAGVLLEYVQQTQMAFLPHVQAPRPYEAEDYVVLDAQTQRNLELVENIFQGTEEGTLFSLLNVSNTSMGRRRLKHWLLHPLRAVARIQERQAGVAELVANQRLRAELRRTLTPIHDLQRLTSRLSSAVANPRDLAALRNSLAHLPRIGELIADANSPLLKDTHNRFDPLEDIHSMIQRMLVDEPKTQATEGGIIRAGVSEELDALYTLGHEGSNWLAEYEAKERARTSIPNLKVGFNKVFGYYIEITKSYLSALPENYHRRQTLVNAERFITDELKQFEEKTLSANERAKKLEYDLFVSLREQTAAQAERLRRTAKVIGALDGLAALAEVAVAYGWTRPEITNQHRIAITEGRHPVVEALNGDFVPNDLYFDEHSTFLILTGPNAAGKSTYARQAAVVVLMAQMGSFVPAEQASIGVVDRIFTRVGAADFLARGLSTFMVEMMETANILRHVTDHSLVILDEVGRGTGSADGQAIAQAVAEALARETRAKTLFTTHYHQLAELADSIPNIANARLAVREESNKVSFLYKVVPGAAQKSYGIYVARLAGLPEPVVLRADALLAELEQQSGMASAVSDTAILGCPSNTKTTPQNETDYAKLEAIVTRLQQVDPLHTTPMEALDFLAQLKQLAQPAGEAANAGALPQPAPKSFSESARVMPLYRQPSKS